ncbi:tRNA1(Val) (adenine(37)-N6)-methyltransferase [Neptunicoccus cionae]|uniref:Methyltransferase n=1 Tax=Neptunicoccus cionae TaxID=2035344 RepID=A0A916VPT1_9RHOB|nr:methyltransferase [Amylibacter cionae]GGA16192.1 methyltransferase [Amylibacter cionae]
MTGSGSSVSLDGFLGGRLQIRQPQTGYRAATDPVFLAAWVPAKRGDKVLELGCGVGVASLCLGARIAGLSQTGLELQADYAALALQNAENNEIPLEVVQGDLIKMPASLKEKSFDHVLANPPFFPEGSVSKPKDGGKSLAFVNENNTAVWIDAGLRRLRAGGVFTMIHLSEQLGEILSALAGRAGNVEILPISARKDKPAKRVLVRATKSARGPLRLLSPFVVHSGAEHVQGKPDYSPEAEGILRHGKGFAQS